MSTENGFSGSGCLGWVAAGVLLLVACDVGAKLEEVAKVVEKLDTVVHVVEADAQVIRTEYLKLKADFLAVEDEFKKVKAFFHWKQDGPQISQEAPVSGTQDPNTGDGP